MTRCPWHKPVPGTDTVGVPSGMPSMFPENRCTFEEGHEGAHSFEGGWFVYDPDPIPEWYPVGGPILVGPFDTEADAYSYANVSHPEDGDGNAVVLQAAGVPGGGQEAEQEDLGGTVPVPSSETEGGE